MKASFHCAPRHCRKIYPQERGTALVTRSGLWREGRSARDPGVAKVSCDLLLLWLSLVESQGDIVAAGFSINGGIVRKENEEILSTLDKEDFDIFDSLEIIVHCHWPQIIVFGNAVLIRIVKIKTQLVLGSDDVLIALYW